jgi:hypothetical protein
MLKAKGTMFKGVSMGKVRVRCESKLCRIAISIKGMELKKAMGSIRGRSHERAKGEGLRLKAG